MTLADDANSANTEELQLSPSLSRCVPCQSSLPRVASSWWSLWGETQVGFCLKLRHACSSYQAWWAFEIYHYKIHIKIGDLFPFSYIQFLQWQFFGLIFLKCFLVCFWVVEIYQSEINLIDGAYAYQFFFLFYAGKCCLDLQRYSSAENARKVFDKIPERKSWVWSSRRVGCCRTDLAYELFSWMEEQNVFSWMSITMGYAKKGHAYDALMFWFGIWDMWFREIGIDWKN